MLIATVLAAGLLPPAQAGPTDCVSIHTVGTSGLVAVILGTGNALSVGLAGTDDVAGGFGLVAIIRPSDCTGLGMGTGSNASTNDPLSSVETVLDPYGSWLPLP